jgi:hypothetical protein
MALVFQVSFLKNWDKSSNFSVKREVFKRGKLQIYDIIYVYFKS